MSPDAPPPRRQIRRSLLFDAREAHERCAHEDDGRGQGESQSEQATRFASETIMNGLRGIGVEVIQVGTTTCGKPYGSRAVDNCGTTYLPIHVRGVNDQGFGDYSEGFSPVGAAGGLAVELPGCAVEDDLSRALGDPEEGLLAAALSYRDTGSCPLSVMSMAVAAKSEAHAFTTRPAADGAGPLSTGVNFKLIR